MNGNKKIDAVIGPGCGAACEVTSYLSAGENIPQISWGWYANSTFILFGYLWAVNLWCSTLPTLSNKEEYQLVRLASTCAVLSWLFRRVIRFGCSSHEQLDQNHKLVHLSLRWWRTTTGQRSSSALQKFWVHKQINAHAKKSVHTYANAHVYKHVYTHVRWSFSRALRSFGSKLGLCWCVNCKKPASKSTNCLHLSLVTSNIMIIAHHLGHLFLLASRSVQNRNSCWDSTVRPSNHRTAVLWTRHTRHYGERLRSEYDK